jgi:hypothetical protein
MEDVSALRNRIISDLFIIYIGSGSSGLRNKMSVNNALALYYKRKSKDLQKMI